MAFPQQNIYYPNTIHLFVDDFVTLLSGGDITTFLTYCQNNCINFLSLYDISDFDYSSIENFVTNSKKTYGICDLGSHTKIFFPTQSSIGLDDLYTLIDYNNLVTDEGKINWLTIDNIFWNLSSDPTLNTSSFLMDTIAGSSTVTVDPSGIDGVAKVGHMLRVKGEWRQIIEVGKTYLVLDRPLTLTSVKTTFTIKDNLTSGSYALDFTTFLYRLKQIRNICVQNGISIEVVLTNNFKKLTATQYNEIMTFADRVLMYDEQGKTYPIYNDGTLQRTRQSLIAATTYKTGTVTLIGNVLNGVGTLFTEELALDNYITINGDQYKIKTIVSDTQATVEQTSTSITIPSNFSNYVRFLPIIDIGFKYSQNWMTDPPSKSFVDVYRLNTINNYLINSVNLQTGNSPIAYNIETNTILTGSTYAEGLSIYSKTNLDIIQSSISQPTGPCSVCKNISALYGLDVTSVNPTCDTALNGSITVTVNGNNLPTPYTYELFDLNYNQVQTIVSNNTTITFTGLPSYNYYTIDVTDGNGFVSNTYQVVLSSSFYPVIQSSGNALIFYISNGAPPYYITSVPAGTFYVSGLTNAIYTYSASNGYYTFLIGDSNTCTVQKSVAVDNTRYLLINTTSTEPTCDAAANGTITININSTGDTSPYVYTYTKSGNLPINVVSLSNTYTLPNVTTGTWTVTASDISGNTSNTLTVNINNSTFNPSLTTVTNNVSFFLTGGTQPYSIVGNTNPTFSQGGLDDGQWTFTSIPNGSYIFTVTDANGCSKNLPATFSNGNNLTLNLISYVNPNCDITSNGQVSLSPNGGTPPYLSYSATNGNVNYTNTSGYFTGLTSDNWTFKVQDSLGLTATLGLLLIDKFNVSYTTTGNTISISASGGSLGNYTVVLNGTPYTYNTATTVNYYTGVCGTNNIQVIDGNLSLSACVYTASTFIVCPLSVTLTATSLTCGGTNPTSNGSVQITATNGVPPYTFNLYNQASQPLTNTTGLFNNLPTGIGLWTATTTDSVNTIVNNTFSLEKSPIDWSVSNSNYTGISVTISGGVSPYQITIRGPLQNTNNIFLQYTANTQGTYNFSAQTDYLYSVQVYDTYFCPSDNVTKSINLQSQLLLGVTQYTTPICTSPYGAVSLSASGGTTPYVSYSATNGSVLYTSTSTIFSGLTADIWTFYVQDSIGTVTNTNYTLLSSNDYTINTNVIYSSSTLDINIDTTYISASTIYVNVLNQDYLYAGTTFSVNYSGCGMVNIQSCAYPPSTTLFTFPNFLINTRSFRSVSLIDGKLFGSTFYGGSLGNGIFFSADTYGNYEILYNFNYNSYSTPTQVGNYLYGTVFSSGIYRYDLSNKTMVEALPGTTSINQSYSKLTLASDGNLYGTLYIGYLFKYVISSDTVTVLHTFPSTGTDGYQPYTAPIEAVPGVLYGITTRGGTDNIGNYYKYILSSNTYVNLGSFSGGSANTGGESTIESLVLINDKLYGTSNTGANFGYGSIWTITLSSDTLTKLIDFPYTSAAKCITLGTDGKIYGTTQLGGNGYGTFFSYDISQNKIKRLSNFTFNTSQPLGGAVELNNKFYGVSSGLGGLGASSLFSVDPNPCCNEKSVFVNPTYTVDPVFTVNFLTGTTRELCVSIDTGNFFSPPYQVIVQNNVYFYDTNIDPNCYPITGCGINTVVISGISCTYSGDVNVSCCPPIVLSIVGVTIPCSANTGVISVTASGGCPPYTYRLNNGQIVTTKTGTTNTIVTYSGLSPNSYRTLIIDSSGNTDTILTMLSFINATLTIQDQDLCLNVSGTNNVAHYVYIDNQLKYTSSGKVFNVCLTGLTGCGVYHTVKIVDSSTGCFFQKPYRINCRPYNIIDLEVSPSLCFNGTSYLTLSVSGGSYPYTFQLQRVSPSVLTISADTTVLNSPTYPYNYANFSISPPSGTWVGKVTDNNGTVKTTPNFNITYVCYADVVFTPTNVVVTFSGAPDWTNVIINGTTYPFLSDGTYTYSVPCGYNEVIVQSVSNVGSPPAVVCTNVFTATTICPLGSKMSFTQPECPGQQVTSIDVQISGGTPNYTLSLSNGSTNYTGVTSGTSFTFYSTGATSVNITGDTWTLRTTDLNLTTFTESIYVDATFDVTIDSLSISGVTLLITGGTPLYNVKIDTIDYNTIFPDGKHYFPLASGQHIATITQPFGTNNCLRTLTINVPYPPLTCSSVFSNPTCGNDIGSLLVSATGGTGLYTYTITDGVDTYTSTPPLSAFPSYPFNGLGAGTWQITVTDSDGTTCNSSITMVSNFDVVVTALTISNSYTVGNLKFTIQGGVPPYDIYVDNIIRVSGTTNLINTVTATTNTTHSYKVVDSSPPATIYTNVPVINDPTFDVPSNWVATKFGNCNSISGITASTIVNGGTITYTSTTAVCLATFPSGCFQDVSFKENYVNTNPFTVGKPIDATYIYEIDFGVKYGMVYAIPRLSTPVSNDFYIRFDQPSSAYGNTTPPIPATYANNTMYSGLITVKTDNTLTYPPVVFSGWGVYFSASGSYCNSLGQIQLRGYDLTLVSYRVANVCSITGNTFLPTISLPTISLVGYTNPNCESVSDGVITVTGTDGVPPYSYSATNGTTNYSSINGIFNGLNAGTWYLSLVDSLGATSTLAQPITLYDTFYANVNSYSNGYCLTVTGGTQPYVIKIDNNPLVWNYNFVTNCYSAACNTTSVITVRDSS